MTEMTPIGFIGLGNMGQPMVALIAKAGYPVIGMDQQPAARAKAAEQAGVTVTESYEELAAVANVVILMLPDSPVVEAVVWGGSPDDNPDPAPGSLAAALKDGSTVIDMSSSFPLRTQKLGEALARRGITMIDAPVSGGVARAITGKLAIMAGGPEERINELKPLLETMGTVQITGGPGTGHAMKALNNYLSASSTIATAEALVIGQRFGLDPDRMADVFNASTGKSNATENKAKQFMNSGAYSSGFTLALLSKDVGMARDLAKGLGLEANALGHTADLLKQMLSRLEPNADHTEVHRDVVNRNAK
jgi:3-hydroxyisobutyrate dehydrogenase